MRNLKDKKGFTMVELLVSMAIIGLLIATAIWGINLAQQSARNTQRRTAGSNIVAGFAEFYARFNVQPDGGAILVKADGTINLTRVSPVKSYTMGGFTGIMAPESVLVDNTTASSQNCTNMKSNASETRYIFGYTPKGIKVCVCLEGGADGSANLSANPSEIFCP